MTMTTEDSRNRAIADAIMILNDIQDQITTILPVMAHAMAEALDVLDPIHANAQERE